MKLIILGARGQLGSDFLRFQREYGYEAVGLTSADIDVSSRDSVRAALDGQACDAIVNTTAYHGYAAYKDASPAKYYATNVLGPIYLAEVAKSVGATIVHYSTDYVFSGNPATVEAFAESDAAIPANLYAASKLAGEGGVQATWDRHLVFRVASIYGVSGCRAKNNSNFVEGILEKLGKGERFEVVGDIRMSPTSTRSIVARSVDLVRARTYGLFHMAGCGSATWYEFAVEIARQSGHDPGLIVRSSTQQVAQDIRRGANTALRNARLVAEGFQNLADWREGLKQYLHDRQNVND